MAWIKAGTTTLTSAGDDITISNTTSNKFNQFLMHTIESVRTTMLVRVGNGSLDSGSNYARRYNANGGSEGTTVSTTSFLGYWNGNVNSRFNVSYMLNISSEEKLYIDFLNENVTAGAGTAPERAEHVGKWANTSSQFDYIGTVNSGAGDYDTDSNISAIGSDGTESLNVQDGAIYYDTDLNKEYVLYNNTWTEI